MYLRVLSTCFFLFFLYILTFKFSFLFRLNIPSCLYCEKCSPLHLFHTFFFSINFLFFWKWRLTFYQFFLVCSFVELFFHCWLFRASLPSVFIFFSPLFSRHKLLHGIFFSIHLSVFSFFSHRHSRGCFYFSPIFLRASIFSQQLFTSCFIKYFSLCPLLPHFTIHCFFTSIVGDISMTFQ